jgi:hypothetical protein
MWLGGLSPAWPHIWNRLLPPRLNTDMIRSLRTVQTLKTIVCEKMPYSMCSSCIPLLCCLFHVWGHRPHTHRLSICRIPPDSHIHVDMNLSRFCHQPFTTLQHGTDSPHSFPDKNTSKKKTLPSSCLIISMWALWLVLTCSARSWQGLACTRVLILISIFVTFWSIMESFQGQLVSRKKARLVPMFSQRFFGVSQILAATEGHLMRLHWTFVTESPRCFNPADLYFQWGKSVLGTPAPLCPPEVLKWHSDVTAQLDYRAPGGQVTFLHQLSWATDLPCRLNCLPWRNHWSLYSGTFTVPSLDLRNQRQNGFHTFFIFNHTFNLTSIKPL